MDDRVRGCLESVTLGILGLPQVFDSPYPAMVQALEADWPLMFPEPELAALMSWGLGLGVALGQRIQDPGRAILARDKPALRVWNPRDLSWVAPAGGMSGRWMLQTADGQIEIRRDDPEWILWFPYGEDRPWSRGLWRSVTFAWLLKQFALMDRARHSEVLGSPIRVGKAGDASTAKARKEFGQELRTMSRDTAMVLPVGWDLDLVESTGRGWEIYQNQIDWADGAIAVLVCGQVVTTEGTSGFSNGNVHERVQAARIRYVVTALSGALKVQATDRWASVNFGVSSGPWVTWDVTPPEDRQANALTLQTLSTAVPGLVALAAQAGREIDVEAMLVAHGVPLRDPVPEAPGAPGAPTPEDDPGPGAAAALAEKMSQYQIPRCEHGSCNQCRKCGIERDRDFTPGPDGSAVWAVRWRPMARVA